MVRRLVALFVIALVGATAYGLSSSSSGVSVNHESVSGPTLRTELAAISRNDTLQCFITALDPTDYAPGAGGFSMKSSGAAAWADLRIEGLAIDQYVTSKYHLRLTPAALAKAKVSLEDEMTAQAKSDSLNCPGTSAEALGEMPGEMRAAEIQSQANSQFLVDKIKDAIPLTAASMKQYYDEHVSDYDRLCVSIALVAPEDVTAFEHSQAAGMSVADLAKKYSQDPSASKGGAYGCYGPTSSEYASVRADVGTEGLNTFATSPQYIDYDEEQYALYVAVTKRTVTPYASASAAVLADLQSLNAQKASELKDELLERAAVYVDPAFGLWGSGTSGPEVLVTTPPAKSGVPGAAKLTSTKTTTYK